MNSRVCTLFLACTLAVQAAGDECIEVPQQKAFTRASVVFWGQVVNRDHLDFSDANEPHVVPHSRPGSEPQLVRFNVIRNWKGPRIGEITVFTFASPSLGSQYRFEDGGQYIVYVISEDIPPADLTWLRKKLHLDKPVYGLGYPCRLRVRADVVQESRLLGKGRKPH